MKKDKLSILTFRITSLLLIIVAILIFISWNNDNKKTHSINNYLLDITNITMSYDDSIPIMDIDFKELTKLNKDTVGWIKIDDTKINYSVVQSTNNDYYAYHNFEKEESNAGWIFMDYKNSITELNDNTTIYGHNRLNQSMFSTLRKLLKEDWHENNKYIYFNTLKNKMTWEVFSVYMIPTEKYSSTNNFNSKEDYKDFLKLIQKRSTIDLNVNVNENDKILTLYTCNRGNTKRIIVHAKLVTTQ